jgi:hypothetical protein
VGRSWLNINNRKILKGFVLMDKNPKHKKTGLNKSYVAGLSDTTAKARKRHWSKTSKMDPKNPAAYEPAPGDATAKTKPSKYTKRYHDMFGEDIEIDESASAGLQKKASESGVSLGILKQVYRRGVAAWRTGHRPGTTPQQWGMARVNSYITKGKTYHTTDKDLRESLWANIHKKRREGHPMRKPGSKGAPTDAAFKSAKESVDPNLPKNREEGTNSLTANYKKSTPGQIVKRVVKEQQDIDEAEYQGRDVPLGKPMKGDVKKSKVYVKNEKGNVVKVNFGDPNMTIKKNIPARRKSFRARHNCDNPGPRTKARFWSCKKW